MYPKQGENWTNIHLIFSIRYLLLISFVVYFVFVSAEFCQKQNVEGDAEDGKMSRWQVPAKHSQEMYNIKNISCNSHNVMMSFDLLWCGPSKPNVAASILYLILSCWFFSLLRFLLFCRFHFINDTFLHSFFAWFRVYFVSEPSQTNARFSFPFIAGEEWLFKNSNQTIISMNLEKKESLFINPFHLKCTEQPQLIINTFYNLVVSFEKWYHHCPIEWNWFRWSPYTDTNLFAFGDMLFAQ